MFCFKKYKTPEQRLKRKNSSESLLSESTADERYGSQTILIERADSQKERRLLIILMALFLAVYSAIENSHFIYSSTYYQYISLRICASEAAKIMSVMATSYTVGRCFSAFVSIKIAPKSMIIYHYFIIIIAMCVLYFGQNSIQYIWFGNVIIGKI